MSNRKSLAVYQVENAVKVSGALSAYLNGRFEPMVALCADDVVWRSIADPEHAAFGGTFVGRAEVTRYFETLFAAYDIAHPRVLDVIPAGDVVLHILQLEAAKRDGTANGSAFVIGRWRFRDGLVASYTDYFDVGASIQSSILDKASPQLLVTRDPSYGVYENGNAVRVSEILEAYTRGDTKPLFAALHPDVEWRSMPEPEHVLFGGTFQGVEAVRDYFRRLAETLVLDTYNVIDVIPAGPETLHVAEVSAHAASDPNRRVFVRLVCIWTFENGRITKMTEYFDIPSYLAQMKPTRPPRN